MVFGVRVIRSLATQRADVGGALEAAAQVAVGDDADEVAARVHHRGHAEPLAR